MAQVSPSDSAVDEVVVEKPATKILNSRSCFSGTFESYDTWAGKLAEKNPQFDRAAFEGRIPRERYDQAKSQLACQRFTYNVGSIVVEGYSVGPSPLEGTLPVVIYNRGGNGAHARITFGSLFDRIFPLAENGYFVIASQYRGSRPQRNGVNIGVDEFGGQDVDDVMALFDIIDDLPFTDTSRIGMFGWSRGAIMSFLAATRTDRLSAIVVGGAPTDIFKELEIRPEMERVFQARIPNYVDNKAAALRSRSVLFWTDRLPKSTPILILHGQSDDRVSVNSALGFAGELQKQNIPYRLMIFENGSHSLREFNSQVNDAIVRWFEDNLD